ncbi:hypothetical protein [Pseudomonas sp. HS6]|uniref:hypothetical protein n=1 Tax=Pseudomonas sp. HS6 TaxID=2850559 RepID=UPI0020196F9E|nr:hypothetical protein [Pseudomonas sp. HS6]UQS17711.1 hypothetical protein JJN09_12880 [Pseudomonas sp. HS6]
MRLSFSDATELIEIGDRVDLGPLPSGSDETTSHWVPQETWQVERFVRWHFCKAQDIQRLRALLSTQHALIHRLDDQEVLRQVSQKLLNGSLFARTVKRTRTGTPETTASTPLRSNDRPSAAPAPVAVKPLVQRKSPTFQPLKADPALTISARVAQDLQAQRLEEAAVQAIPFCELCRRNGMENA